jgi:hypothetical protein
VISPSQRPLPTQDNTAYKHNRQTSMPRAGFETAIPVTKQPQTYALDRPLGSAIFYINAYISDNTCEISSSLSLSVWSSDLYCGMYCHVKYCRPTFQRYVLPPSRAWLWRQHVPLKRRSTIILHGSTSQNTNLNWSYFIILYSLFITKHNFNIVRNVSLTLDDSFKFFVVFLKWCVTATSFISSVAVR